MLYKPGYGKFKDNCLFYNDGIYYLYSMFTKSGEEYKNVWLARSYDGVHWEDAGPVIEDSDFYIWAMAVYRVGNIFIMNHGSFDKNNVQNTLKFWKSSDLVNWEYMGEEYDVVSPDGKSRLDCMNVFFYEGTYYGYATGVYCFLKSADGIRWEFCDNKIDFTDIPEPVHDAKHGFFEVGDCKMIDGNVYYLGGMFNYMGRQGYGVYTFKSDSPENHFIPDISAFRLCGNSQRWVSMWARFCDDGKNILVTGYMQDGYSYECGNTWMPPLKKAITENGHLRLKYRDENNLLKSEYMGEIKKTNISADEYSSTGYIPEKYTVSDFYDISGDVYIKGKFIATRNDKWTVVPSFEIILKENESQGTAFRFHGYGKTETGILSLKSDTFVSEDVIDMGCAAPSGITPGKEHEFIIIKSKNMFELYLDGYYITTGNTTHYHDRDGISPSEIGFGVICGNADIYGVEIWKIK